MDTRADAARKGGLSLLKNLVEALTTAVAATETGAEFEVFQEIDFYDAVRQFEISLIRQALTRTGGNQAQAARLLHLKQTTLHGKIKQYKIYHTVIVGHGTDPGVTEVGLDDLQSHTA